MNFKQFILTAITTTLVSFSQSAAAESDNQDQQNNNGYPDYLIQASYESKNLRGNTFQSNQGNNGTGNNGNHDDKSNNGKKNRNHTGKGQIANESAWYKPWSWYGQNPDDDDGNNQNSNRQSDPDSTRGQARAAERHDDKNNSETEHSWYDPRGWFE